MGKTAQRRNAVRTRIRILRTAGRLFGQRGFAATSMRDIGAAAGIRAPTMYHYFPSKTALLREIFALFYGDLASLYGEIGSKLPAGCSLRLGLRLFMERHRTFLASRRDETYLFFLEALRPGSPLSRSLKKLTKSSSRELHRLASHWRGLQRDRVVTLFMGVVSMNVFFLMAGKYMANSVRIGLSPEEQVRTLELLFEDADSLEKSVSRGCGRRTA